jgi:MFS family permease
MVPFMIFAIRKQKEQPMFTSAVLLFSFTLFLLWYLPNDFITLIVLMVLFFTAFNYLEATMPSILSRIAPAGVKGSVMGIYSSSQFLGAFSGGLLGGVIASQFGEQMIFLIMACMGALWVIVAVGMKPVKKSKNYSFSTTIDCQEKAEQVAEQLINMPGVVEATLVHSEATAYLKVDDKLADISLIKSLLKPG